MLSENQCTPETVAALAPWLNAAHFSLSSSARMQHGHIQAVFYIFIFFFFFYLNTNLIFYLFIFNSLDLRHWINHARNKYVNQQGSSAIIMLLHKNNTRDIDTVLWLHEFITHQTSTVFYSQNFFLSCPVFGCPGLFCYHAVTAFRVLPPHFLEVFINFN